MCTVTTVARHRIARERGFPKGYLHLEPDSLVGALRQSEALEKSNRPDAAAGISRSLVADAPVERNRGQKMSAPLTSGHLLPSAGFSWLTQDAEEGITAERYLPRRPGMTMTLSGNLSQCIRTNASC